MNVDNLIFYSQDPLNDGGDEHRDDGDLLSSVRDDEINKSIMLLECLSGAGNKHENEQCDEQEREERLAATNALEQYFSQYACEDGASFGAMDDDASALLPTGTPSHNGVSRKSPSSFTVSTSSSSPTSSVSGSKPHTPRRISLRPPKTLTPKKNIGSPFAFKRNVSVGRKEIGHRPFVNKRGDEQFPLARDPPTIVKDVPAETAPPNNDTYVLVDGTWLSPSDREERDEPEPESEPELEPSASAKNATSTAKVVSLQMTNAKNTSVKRAGIASPLRLPENKKDIRCRQRVKITVTEAFAPTPSPATTPTATPAPVPSSIAPEPGNSQLPPIAISTEIPIAKHPASVNQNQCFDGGNGKKEDLAMKGTQREIEAKSNEESFESAGNLRQVYFRTLEIMIDLSKSEAEHDIVKILNQNIGRTFGAPNGSKQQEREAGSLPPTTCADGMVSTEDIMKESTITAGGASKKSSVQSTTGKKLNVSFNLSDDIRYFIKESMSEASLRYSSSYSHGSNEDNEGSSASVEYCTYDSYSSVSTFEVDREACGGKVNEILSEIKRIAASFNVFNGDAIAVWADESSADVILESDQENARSTPNADVILESDQENARSTSTADVTLESDQENARSTFI